MVLFLDFYVGLPVCMLMQTRALGLVAAQGSEKESRIAFLKRRLLIRVTWSLVT